MILLTGGAGYIGSHVLLRLLQSGHEVVVLDNFSNSCAEPLHRVEKLCGKRPILIEADVRDAELLDRLFAQYKIHAVMNFAGLKAVGESVQKPLDYYHCNVFGAITLLQAMAKAGCKRFIFSSTATVYGENQPIPYVETMPLGRPTHPYGRSKLFIEEILSDLIIADPEWHIGVLRYFNPVGAHESGEIGEDPNGIPNNLLPYIAKVAVGALPQLNIFGDDYPTKDGTGVRDYLHVMDLAEGHLKALSAIWDNAGRYVWNLGTGVGYSVLEMVKAFEAASGRNIPYQIVPRRAGDIAEFYSNSDKALADLNWKANKTLEDMMIDTWRWQSQNPNGYKN